MRVRFSAFPKKISQSDASTLLVDLRSIVAVTVTVKGHLIQLLNAKLFWSDEPEVAFSHRFERGTAIDVEGTDITPLLDLLQLVLEDDAQRQALRAANGWAILIDPACTFTIQKGTGPHWVRIGTAQQIPMPTTDLLGLDTRNRQIVETTGRTTSPTLKTLCMKF